MPLKRNLERGILLNALHTLRKLGILWSHNEQTYPNWLTTVAEAIKFQGFVWWDVGWKVKADRLVLPVTGYIGSTSEGKIIHRTLIESIETLHQPEKELANQVAENYELLIKKAIYRPLYDKDIAPLYMYLKGEKETLTLLQLTEFEKLRAPLELKNIKLPNGTSPTRLPQAFYYITFS